MANLIDKTTKKLMLATALLGMLAVIIGAFGAHSLDGKISAGSLLSYKTGVSYQFYHTLGSAVAIILYLQFHQKQFRHASFCFLIGILLFSGSIYLLTTNDITGIGLRGILGPMTPIGGLFFILGWIYIFYGVITLKSE